MCDARLGRHKIVNGSVITIGDEPPEGYYVCTAALQLVSEEYVAVVFRVSYRRLQR